ncbi:MAG: hypothetical protein LUF04_08500 [Bacteroides sp.]|nr:hypothetical protein [Bacteroides sp.]
MKKTVLPFLVLLLSVGCQSDKTREVIVEDMYSISLPGYLSEANDLNEDASLQYQNMWKEFYVIVIDDLKSEMQDILEEHELLEIYPNDLEGYSDLIWDGFEEDMDVQKITDPMDDMINGRPVKYRKINAVVEGVDVFYYFAIVEGKDRFYQILTWTLTERQKSMRKK